MTDRIHTTEHALERVSRDDSLFKLGAAHINGHALPPLCYNGEASTIRSHGARKYDVTVKTMPVFGDLIITIGDGYADAEWSFGSSSSAAASEKRRIQTARARALIRHAIEALW